MKLVHLSDFHLNTFYTNSNLDKIEKILKFVASQNFDHLVITGDLTDNAMPDDFRILRGLFKSLGLLRSDKMSLVIGNHDIFGGIQTAEDILTFPERCSLTDYNQKVNDFKEYFPEVFENCVYNSPNVFPFAKIIDGVLIAGVNSIAQYSRITNPFASNGEIGIEQFCEMNDIFTDLGDYIKSRIVLIHHHFNKMTLKQKSSSSIWQNIEKQTMKLRKKKRLFKLFNEHNIDLILHGHVHQNSIYERKGLKFINAGGCVKGCQDDLMKINYIDIKPGNLIITSQKVRVSENGNIFKTSRNNIPGIDPAIISVPPMLN